MEYKIYTVLPLDLSHTEDESGAISILLLCSSASSSATAPAAGYKDVEIFALFN